MSDEEMSERDGRDDDDEPSIIFENEMQAHGQTYLHNAVLKTPHLTHGAKLCYAILQSYAWEGKKYCFPGQERLAQDLCVGRDGVWRYLKELAEKGFIRIRRRGLGKTNVYTIRDLKDVFTELGGTGVPLPDSVHTQAPSAGKTHTANAGKILHTVPGKTQHKENQVETNKKKLTKDEERPASQPDTRASTREAEPRSGLVGLGLNPLGNKSTRGEETELQAMWRTVHAVTAILDDPVPSDEELGNYFTGVQENWYYNGTSKPADLLAVAREQRAGARWPPASKSAQFRVYARNRTGRGDLNPRPKTKSGQNGHALVPASNPAWNDRPADTWHDPEADRLHAITMARMGIDENGNEITPAPDQKGPAA